MESESKLANYLSATRYEELSQKSIDTVKNVVLTVLGTTIAGARAEGCEILANQVKEWGGKEEATVLVWGGKVPAHNAALVNSTMARALDYCDAMLPGPHLGSSSVPTALATAELVGGCSGKEFLTALVLGMEVAARINSISVYNGFDATGVCSVFAAAGIAGRILRLDSHQMANALALAFNRAGGSFQSIIDSCLAVRVIQGFASQGGITCAQLAQRGITGPKNFLEGVYGYFHLFAKDRYNTEAIVGELGQRYELDKLFFKKYPSCGATLASTDAILELARERRLSPDDISRIEVRMSPYFHNLVGNQFEVGDNPKVNAQFSAQYCVANALLRGSSRLHHFDEAYIRDPEISELTKLIRVSPDPAIDDPEKPGGSLRTYMDVFTKKGKIYRKMVDVPRGMPGNPLSKEEHLEHFKDCIAYADSPVLAANTERVISFVDRLEQTNDVRGLIPLLTVNSR